MAKTRVLVLAAWALSASAAERVHFTVTAVTHKRNVDRQIVDASTPTRTSTNCNGTAINTGPVTTGNVQCGSVTTGGPAITTVTRVFADQIVEANGERFALACVGNSVLSNCDTLVDGDTFEAEYDGKTTMWIHAHQGGNLGKLITIKYRVLDSRPISRANDGLSPDDIARAIRAAKERHPDLGQFETRMTELSKTMEPGLLTADQYVEALYAFAKGEATHAH